MLAHLKTVSRRRLWYSTMPPSASGGGAAPPPSIAAAPTGNAFSTARVSHAGGPGQVNYELGHSKTSWRRVKEMESLGFFPVGCAWAAGAETSPRTDDKVLVFESLFLAGVGLPCHDFLTTALDKFKV
jgi:hypothetical protein